MTDPDLIFQIEAFTEYRSRGGCVPLEDWMARKDFAPRDRARLRELYKRAAR